MDLSYKIYVIQSLNPNKDKLTGNNIYDISKHFISSEIFNIDTPSELFEKLSIVENECSTDKISPIIHFEMHGLEDKSGLALNQGVVKWKELYEYLSKINRTSGFNLFITMAVCFGSYAMELLSPWHPAPYYGIVGSFELLQEGNLEISFEEFYNEFKATKSFNKAFTSLQMHNTNMPKQYRLITAEQTFKNLIQRYFDTEFNREKLQSRSEGSIVRKDIDWKGTEPINRKEKRKWKRGFIKLTKDSKRKRQYYQQSKSNFFMFETFPDNKNRFCKNWEPKM